MPPRTPLKPRVVQAGGAGWIYDREGRRWRLCRGSGHRATCIVPPALARRVARRFSALTGMARRVGWADDPISMYPAGEARGGRLPLMTWWGTSDSKPFGHEFAPIDHLRRVGASARKRACRPGTASDPWIGSPSPCRRGPGADRLHGGVGRRDADVPADGPRSTGSRSRRPSSWSRPPSRRGCVCENAAGLRLGTDNVGSPPSVPQAAEARRHTGAGYRRDGDRGPIPPCMLHALV